MTAIDGTTGPHRPGVVAHWIKGDRTPAGEIARSPGVSVVLCTYKRPDSVRRFLDSLAKQSAPVGQLIVVDASPEIGTERAVASYTAFRNLFYWRVESPLRGLTRQRNFGLEHVAHDLVAFFDDDVVLDTHCIAEMERAHRESPDLAGLGCFAETFMQPTLLWRVRRALRMVPHLRPGAYTRTGMSVPWRFHAPTTALVEGDWLPGCAMMLKTEAALAVRFDEALAGYGQGEDLDFSLRLRARGRIAMAGAAHCEHFHAPAGRPDAFRVGQMEICNRYLICRRVHQQPRLIDRAGFAYAWSVDTLLLLRDTVRPGLRRHGIRRIAGRVSGASRVLTGRLPA